MNLAVTPVSADEGETFLQAAELPFGSDVRAEEVALWSSLLEVERAFAVRDGGRIVGTAANLTMDVSVPGGARVPMAGVTAVGVWPSHRRRGIARDLMRTLHRDARERGEPVAGLWASESRIYGRFGYGNAVAMARWEIATAHGAFRAPVDLRGAVRVVEPEEALGLLAALHRREADRRAGLPVLHEQRARAMTVMDPEHWRDGGGPRYLAAVGERGLGAYRVVQRWPDGSPGHLVRVENLYADDDEAYALLWRYVLDLDLVSEMSVRAVPVDAPLPLLLDDPRRLKTTVSDSLWLRPLDVPALLEARAYAVDGVATIAVADPDGYAEGAWTLEVAAGMGACTPAGGREPDLTLPVDSLGAAYLGGTRLTALGRAGRAWEHTPGSLRRLDLMLSADPLPWCPFVF